jgi:hypothetical protein
MDLYKPKWTDEIQNEWIDNLLLKREDLERKKLEKTKDAMNDAFPDTNVANYQELIAGLSLNDKDDIHVLAAAIRGNANVIITFNLKDFPFAYLKNFAIEPQHPDIFISNIINLRKNEAMEALDNLIKSLRNPQKTKEEVLETLKNCGLKKAVILLEE